MVSSMIPRSSGDQIKTDRRDTIHPARLFRADVLTRIYAPDKEDKASRDLVRCRLESELDPKKRAVKIQILEHIAVIKVIVHVTIGRD